MQHLSLLKLMYLVSPALPIGSYAYSQGQEYAVDGDWLKGEHALTEWILGVLKHSLATTDGPVLLRLYDAWSESDFAAVDRWNDFLIAGRETKELLLEDEQLGRALKTVLNTHGVAMGHELESTPSFAAMFARAGVSWAIPKTELLHGFYWAWIENQVAAATKAIPLGQTHAQKILMQLLPEIPPLVELAETIDENDIGAGLPGLAMASSLHERQYSRLFRS